MHLHDTCPVQGKDCFNCGIEGHFGRLCRKKKETPVDDADTVRAPMETLDPAGGIQPRDEVMDQPAVSLRDLAAKGRGLEAPDSGAESRDATMRRQSGKDGREVFSTNIWPPLESRVWRPGMVLADDQFKSCRESPQSEKHSRSPNVYGTPGGEPSDFEKVIRSSKSIL